MRKDKKNKLSKASTQLYSPSLYLDRIWSVNAGPEYFRRYRWVENGVSVPDSDPEITHQKGIIVAIRTLNGEGVLELENQKYELTHDTLIFFYINQPRKYRAAGEKWNYHWIEFKLDYFFFPMNRIIYIKSGKQENKLLNKLAHLLNENNTKYASSLFSAQLVFWAQQGKIPEKTGNNEVLVESIVKYIADNYAQPLKVEEIARAFHVSSRHMLSLFSAATGMSPVQFITDTRLKAAKELLIGDNQKIAAIAVKTGFSNQYYFSRCFKQKTGMSPGQFRQAHPDKAKANPAAPQS